MSALQSAAEPGVIIRPQTGAMLPDPHHGLGEDIAQHLPALRAYARLLCRRTQDPDDLVQETLLRAIEYAHGYRPGTNLRAWLFTIMRSRFYNTWRRQSRERTADADCASTLPRCLPSQEWHLRRKELLAAVLSESYIAAAGILGCDIGAVKSRVCRARQRLRDALDPDV